ncbi:MAG: acyl carrier protein [Nostoc sp. DedQUE08]|uniref:acyl carrier protein n=1 Tax=Nostoc sp. DedQUE08 TaxID=3075393 RepID=UPI002AD50B43|nr:acyl carrier protein [Nostoc sp. DedQUE08]MDZ8064392.1 acyl carrier protein [Nostoc sp. DedQUE08]
MELENLQIDSTLKASEVLKTKVTVADIQAWLISYLATALEIASDEIDVTLPLHSYGLDSSAAVSLTGDLGDFLECQLEPDLLIDYPTIEALAQHLGDIEEITL